MATVPLQQTPEVGLEIGSAPQFTGGRIEPVQDTVTDDIQRFSQAQRDVANIAIKLQDKILQNCKDKELIYINDNISNINFSDATIIFTNSVMFSEEFMNELEYKASICKNLKYFSYNIFNFPLICWN